EIAALPQGAHEEARVEEMQYGMLDAADILVDRHPVRHLVGLESLVRARRAEAQEIPRRFEEGVERVGLALRLAAAARAVDVLPGRMMGQRIARLVEADIVRQGHRQRAFRHRNDAAIRAVDHRNGTTPIALPRDPPVAQAIDGRALAVAELFEALADRALGGRDRQPVDETRI